MPTLIMQPDLGPLRRAGAIRKNKKAEPQYIVARTGITDVLIFSGWVMIIFSRTILMHLVVCPRRIMSVLLVLNTCTCAYVRIYM